MPGADTHSLLLLLHLFPQQSRAGGEGSIGFNRGATCEGIDKCSDKPQSSSELEQHYKNLLPLR